MPSPSLSSPKIEAFLEMMSAERACARNTLIAYGKDLADAHAFTVARGRPLDRAEAADVEAYFADVSVRGLSPATAARRRASVRQFYRFAWRRAGAGTIPPAGWTRPSCPAAFPSCCPGKRWSG